MSREALRRLPPVVHRTVPVGVRDHLRRRLGLPHPGDLAHRPGPPPVPAGEVTGPPDVVLVGPAATGARWWLRTLADHPDVAPPRHVDTLASAFGRYATEAFGPDDVAGFHRWFPRRPGRTVLHWSPHAAVHPWVTPLLAAAAPAARVVMVVRDPLARLRSDLAASAERAVPHLGSALAAAVDRGAYGTQLARLHAAFGPDRVLVLQYERLVAEPAAALAATEAFCGLPAVGGVPTSPPPHPVTDGADGLDPDVAARLVDLVAGEVAALAGRVPDLDLDRWPSVAAAVGR